MTASPESPERQTIEARAAGFLVRLHNGADPSERQAIFDWIEADPRHAVAFARMEAAWEAGERLKASPPSLDPLEAPGDIEPSRPVSRRVLIGASIAASAAAMGVTAAWRYAGDVDLHHTRLGERRVITLADGSRIHLNTASAVEVAMRKHSRRVRLVKGEALFEVAHDPDRPFLVDAGAARLRAVGTAFNVRIRDTVVELTVTEGVVAVGEGPVATATDLRRPGVSKIKAGGGAVIGSGAVAPTALGAAVLRQRTAWQDGVIELDGETLAQAVAEFNRYRATPIIIGDPRLANLRVGGVSRLVKPTSS
ncbi:FecR family protein [Caulobacter segnis]